MGSESSGVVLRIIEKRFAADGYTVILCGLFSLRKLSAQNREITDDSQSQFIWSYSVIIYPYTYFLQYMLFVAESGKPKNGHTQSKIVRPDRALDLLRGSHGAEH